MTARLITIPFSHFCEKARWALDRTGVAYKEDGHLPVFHYLPVKRAGGVRSVPVLVTEREVIADSTPIIAYADAHDPGALLPRDDAQRTEALALEDELDRRFGPATRRWMYFHLLPRKDLDGLVTHGVPAWEARALKLTRPLAVAFLRRSLKIDAAGVERSRVKIEETFERIAERLRDGRRYLVGDTFSVADLTFAALAGPILLPREYGAALPAIDVFAGAARDQLERWRATPAGQFGLRLYATERSVTRRAA